MRILYDLRWEGAHGIGRYSREVYRCLQSQLVPLRNGPKPSSPIDTLWLCKVLKTIKPDLFYSPGYNLPIGQKTPFICTLHDIMHIRVPGEAGWLKKFYFNFFLKKQLCYAQCIFTVSEFSRQDILSWCPDVDPKKVIVTGNGYSDVFTQNGEKAWVEAPYFLYVGNRKAHKNIARMLEAFRLAKLSHPDLKLVMTGFLDNTLKRFLEKYRFVESVILLGVVDDIELAAYYRGAVGVLTPSLYEGFGLSVIEGQACGTPVIAGNLTALPEVAGNAALLVNPYDVKAIATAMHRILTEPELVSRLRVLGLENVKRYTWQSVADKIAKVLDEVAGEIGV